MHDGALIWFWVFAIAIFAFAAASIIRRKKAYKGSDSGGGEMGVSWFSGNDSGCSHGDSGGDCGGGDGGGGGD
jgi:hypothetical protein